MTPRSSEHGVPETVHLTEQNFDEALIANEGLVMVDFWAEWWVRSMSGDRAGPRRAGRGLGRSGDADEGQCRRESGVGGSVWDPVDPDDPVLQGRRNRRPRPRCGAQGRAAG